MVRTSGVRVTGVPRCADSPAAFIAFLGLRRLRGVSPSVVDAVAAGIERMEGFYPGSVAWRNNNPGNLRFAGQPGAKQGAGGFAAFDSVELGRNALRNQISLNIERGYDATGRPIVTLADLITSWAPPNENDTAAYIRNVAAWTGIAADAPLSTLGAPDYSIDVFLPAGDGVGTGDGLGVDGGAGDRAAALPWDTGGDVLAAGLDLSAFTGGSDYLPWWMVGAGVLAGALVIRRLFS